MKRRKFLQVAGTSSAAVAAAACDFDKGHVQPYLSMPEDIIPGIPTVYASTCRECPAGCGILVKTREGRAIKVEGNPRHPVNRGRLCARGQAQLQGLYDADRLTGPLKREGNVWRPITWEAALQELGGALGAAAAAGADRVALISGAESGPLDAYYDQWLAAHRSSRRLRYEAFAHEPLREASRLVFGLAAVPHHDFAAARYVLSFGADFLETWISPTANTIGFAASHGWREGRMAKFVAVEARRGMTGFNADRWLAPRPGTEAIVALGIAAAIVRSGRSRNAEPEVRALLARWSADTVAAETGLTADDINTLAAEFAAASPSLAVAGGVANQHSQATNLAVAVHILNHVAGNVGRTVTFPATSWERLGRYADLQALATACEAGNVDVAIVRGANPAFTAPAGLDFATKFARARVKVAFVTTMDETARLCDYALPDLHALESWDVVEPQAGLRGFVQPVMRPVHEGCRQMADVLIALSQSSGRAVPGAAASAREMIERSAGAAVTTTLQGGGVFQAAPPRPVRLNRDFARLSFAGASFEGPEDGLALLAVPSVSFYDGRGANKPILQELPDVATKVTWQTWVEVHPATAARLGLRNGDVVTVAAASRSVEAITLVYPGVRQDTVAMPIGQGHTAFGRWAQGRGANPLALLGDVTDASGALAFAQVKVTLTKAGRRVPLATTEGSARQHGRGIARLATAADAGAGHFVHDHDVFTPAETGAVARAMDAHERMANIGEYTGSETRWEMVIDLSRCTGCSACVTACHAENNIPHAGEDQVIRGREMSWIRIERYYEGDTAGTDYHVAQIPMLCQQCEKAPCEPVCPVYAAYHTPDGLNGQIYNRCVGTRYCANNCPYKVRYFNWWDYGTPGAPKYAFPDTLSWALNPEVTVRSKGVMEKCTFCVQRIRWAQNEARVRGDLPVPDSRVVPACAQTCPASAITMGNARNPESRVSRLKQDPRGYHVLGVLATKPGVTYLTRIVDAETVHAGAAEGH
jgi:anaerobic selenocysteine-containing dehydrogenase/Fe-S-cluster-containing dehydrogenase component